MTTTADTPLLRVENLQIGFAQRGGRTRSAAPVREVVKGVSLTLRAGECLALVGESGSGKSVTARTFVGLTGPRSQVTADRLEFDGRDLRGLGDQEWRGLRGRDVGFVLQDALVSLDQLRPVGKEVAEVLELHRYGNRRERTARVLELLEQVGVPQPEVKARQLPGELSGGQRQRALIASAIALDPKLIIADEPTTALDVTVQARILKLLGDIKQRGSALVLISHDLAVVAQVADHVAVMRNGEIVEQGVAKEILADPQHEYTKALLDAIPTTHSRGTRLSRLDRPRLVARPDDSIGLSEFHPSGEPDAPILEARNIVKRYRGPDGVDRTVVDDVSFTLGPGETLGIIGESGSGKTTTARVALALTQPDEGEVLLGGRPWSALSERQRRGRRPRISVIYQDPFSSFDPRWDVERILLDSLLPGRYTTAKARTARVTELLAQVGLEAEHRHRHPLELSGGQRQRVAIARALGPEPTVIVCDEPVSALDVSIQAQVLDLLTDLQSEFGVSYLFISHDLGVIHHVSDRVLVLKDGKAVETGTGEQIFSRPQHPYTQELLASLPKLDRIAVRAAGNAVRNDDVREPTRPTIVAA